MVPIALIPSTKSVDSLIKLSDALTSQLSTLELSGKAKSPSPCLQISLRRVSDITSQLHKIRRWMKSPESQRFQNHVAVIELNNAFTCTRVLLTMLEQNCPKEKRLSSKDLKLLDRDLPAAFGCQTSPDFDDLLRRHERLLSTVLSCLSLQDSQHQYDAVRLPEHDELLQRVEADTRVLTPYQKKHTVDPPFGFRPRDELRHLGSANKDTSSQKPQARMMSSLERCGLIDYGGKSPVTKAVKPPSLEKRHRKYIASKAAREGDRFLGSRADDTRKQYLVFLHGLHRSGESDESRSVTRFCRIVNQRPENIQEGMVLSETVPVMKTLLLRPFERRHHENHPTANGIDRPVYQVIEDGEEKAAAELIIQTDGTPTTMTLDLMLAIHLLWNSEKQPLKYVNRYAKYPPALHFPPHFQNRLCQPMQQDCHCCLWQGRCFPFPARIAETRLELMDLHTVSAGIGGRPTKEHKRLEDRASFVYFVDLKLIHLPALALPETPTGHHSEDTLSPFELALREFKGSIARSNTVPLRTTVIVVFVHYVIFRENLASVPLYDIDASYETRPGPRDAVDADAEAERALRHVVRRTLAVGDASTRNFLPIVIDDIDEDGVQMVLEVLAEDATRNVLRPWTNYQGKAARGAGLTGGSSGARERRTAARSPSVASSDITLFDR